MEYPIGQAVVVRSSQSGVWHGTLRACEVTADGLVSCALSDARRIWSWEGAGSCSGLAAHGPRSGRIAPPVRCVVQGCCEVLEATAKASERISSIEVWEP